MSSLTPPVGSVDAKSLTHSNSSSDGSNGNSSSAGDVSVSSSSGGSPSPSTLQESIPTDMLASPASADLLSAYQKNIYMHTKKQMEAAAKMARRRPKKHDSGPDAHATLQSGGSSGSGSDA